MERSLKYFLSYTVVCTALTLSCSGPQQPLDPGEKDEQIELKFKEANSYYQGSVNNMKHLAEVLELDPENAEAWRELSIPYLKRGYPHLWWDHYEKAFEYGPEEWAGWFGTNLFFTFKDYEKALKYFNALDTLTPNFTDYPQATSDLYLRALCYYGLGDYEHAMEYMDRHIANESSNPGGFDFIDPHTFLYRGIIKYKQGDYESSLVELDTGLSLFDKSADLHFHKAKAYLALNRKQDALESLEKAREFFELGYFNSRPYVEVLEQIYDYDLEELELLIVSNEEK